MAPKLQEYLEAGQHMMSTTKSLDKESLVVPSKVTDRFV